MAAQKLKDLTSYLLEKKICAARKLTPYVEGATLAKGFKDLGNGLLICRFEYTAILFIEDFAGDAHLLFAFISTWLFENDECRDNDELLPPSIEVDEVDDKTAEVSISIQFIEDITITKDANGLIDFLGETWSLSVDPAGTVVDAIGVGDDSQKPTDAVHVG